MICQRNYYTTCIWTKEPKDLPQLSINLRTEQSISSQNKIGKIMASQGSN